MDNGKLRIYWMAWSRANQEYLAARYAYDTAVRKATEQFTALKNDFLRKKSLVKAATDAYYHFLNEGKPVTLSVQEERQLFSEADLKKLKEIAQIKSRAKAG